MLRKERAVRARLGSIPAKNIYVLSTIPVNYRICSIRSYLKTRQGGGHDDSMYPVTIVGARVGELCRRS
jgi:hypothetical protein